MKKLLTAFLIFSVATAAAQTDIPHRRWLDTIIVTRLIHKGDTNFQFVLLKEVRSINTIQLITTTDITYYDTIHQHKCYLTFEGKPLPGYWVVYKREN